MRELILWLLLGLVTGAVLKTAPLAAQATARLYGTYNGASKPLTGTAQGYLNVVAQ